MASRIPTATRTTMTDQPSNIALLRLMAWLSPAFPVGSFSYSHGLEQAV
ncbi:MAG: urease accessory protein UreF, partial [Mesorhizobium sp.]